MLAQQVPSAVGASYRYWRITQTARIDATYSDASEWQLLSGGTNVILGVVGVAPTPGGWAAFGSTPAMLTDGNTSALVSDSAVVANARVTFDLGVARACEQFVWHCGNAFRGVSGLTVSGSNDNTTFTVVRDFTGITGWVTNSPKTFNL